MDSVDALVCSKHDGRDDRRDDGTAPVVIRPARRPPIRLITDRAVPSSVPLFRRILV